MQRSSRRKSSKISEAVFRGQRSLYTFDVFPLSAKDIADAAGIFIISRRRTDKFGSGHHSTICIGETASIVAELKRHRRGKCVKRTSANAVCILKVESLATRREVVNDLISSRTFACVRNKIKAEIKPRPAIVEPRPERTRRRQSPVELAPAKESPKTQTVPRQKRLLKKKTTGPKRKPPLKTAKRGKTKKLRTGRLAASG